MKKIKSIIISVFVIGLLAVNMVVINSDTDNNGSLKLSSLFNMALADGGEDPCNGCPPGYSCVGGTCIQLEKSYYRGCSTTVMCKFLGIPWWEEDCDGHEYDCEAEPTGSTSCSNTNCECDEDPC